MAAASLPSALLAHARHTPDRAFVEVWDEAKGVVQTVSYSDLAGLMLGAADFLHRDCAVVAGDRVALLAHNSIAFLAVSLGAMVLGGTSLHLNWRMPSATTRRLLLGLAPKLLCASAPFVEDARSLCGETSLRLVLLLNPHAPPCGSLPLSHPSASSLVTAIAALEADVPAAVFFTGGTTGDPKAVPHTHSSLLWLAEFEQHSDYS